MAKKRGAGEGTISKRKDGRWAAAVTVGYGPDGQQKRKFYYGKTRQEVAEKLREALNNKSMGIVIDSKNITLKQWLSTWLDEYRKPKIRQTSYEYYSYVIQNYICHEGGIGHIKLKDLRPDQLQKLYNSTLKQGYSPSTIKIMHILLKGAMKQAVKNNLIIRDITEGTERPRLTKGDKRVFTLDEQKRFQDALSNEKYSLIYMLGLSTGLRIGELLGLRWQDINTDEGWLQVRQTLVRVKNTDDNADSKTKLIFHEPKTESGERTVPIPSNLIPLLEKHEKSQKENKLKSYGLYRDDLDLVFCDKLGEPLEPSNIRSRLYKLTEKAGIDHTNMHALRHTFATRGLENGIELKVMQEILGHSSIAMTANIYSHVLPDKKKEAAEKINHLFA